MDCRRSIADARRDGRADLRPHESGSRPPPNNASEGRAHFEPGLRLCAGSSQGLDGASDCRRQGGVAHEGRGDVHTEGLVGEVAHLRDLAAHGIEPARTLEIGSTEAIKQVVAAGFGISIVSVASVQDQVQLGRLKVLALRDMAIERTLWQLTIPARVAMPAARAFEKLLFDRSICPDERLDRAVG